MVDASFEAIAADSGELLFGGAAGGLASAYILQATSDLILIIAAFVLYLTTVFVVGMVRMARARFGDDRDVESPEIDQWLTDTEPARAS